jgi:hypothetical protein
MGSLEKERSSVLPSCVVCCALLFCLVAGCKNSNELETAQASGKVLLDGKPLTCGTVTFVPTRGRAAEGKIQADGTFTLGTYRAGDGAIVGKHRAAIVVLKSLTAKVSPERDESIMAIPDHYTSAEASGLEYEVKPGQANEFTIELKSSTR